MNIKEIIERLMGLNLLQQEVQAIAANIKELSQIVRDHESRLIRIETLIELARQRRLSK